MSTSTLKGVSALSALSSLSPHPLPCYRNRLRRLQECQHFTLDFDEDFDLTHDSHPETPLYPVNPTQNSSLSSLSSTFNLQSSPSSSSSQPSPLSLSSSASASASSSSPGDSLPHDVDHFSFGPPFAPSPTPRPHPLGPTLKCIRNSLPLSLSESLAMKRYDRLSSSKSDLHLSPSSSVAESSVDEAESLDEKVTPLGKATSASRSSADLTLEVSGKSSSTLLESYSSTENIIPPSTSGSTRAISGGGEEDHFRLPEGELWEGPSGNSGLTSGTSGVTLPSTNTFKSFIKTKTSSGIGIMRTGKDLHHHHGLSHGLHHRGGLEDDEEALQLCDSESTTSTVSSSHLKEVASAPPTGSHLISGSSFSSSTSASSSVKGSSSAGAAASSAFHQINSSSSPLVTSASSATPTSAVSSPAPPPLPSHQAIFLANPCHSTLSNSTSCSCPSNGPSSTQTTLTSLDSTTSKQLAQLYQQQQASLGGQNLSLAQGEYLCPQTLLPPLSTQTPPSSGGKSRHLRSTLLPPLLKPNRFVKHSKGNLLFNVKSGHKSKSKQRLTEAPSKERLNSSTSGCGGSPSRNSELLVESLKSDRLILTQPEEDRRRRTILIEKSNNSFGFTLQTYGIKHCREGEVELITYVDEVAYGGPAFRGGMRPGDVILSINGRDVEKADHRSLVTAINGCEKTMRLVVLFEDCVRKIELNIKYIKLKKALQQKVAQLEILNQRENQLLLNAALRHRGSLEENEKENLVNNNRLLPDSGLCQLKKYKCKSLDVSLDELNTVVVTNINNNTFEATTNTGPGITGKSVESGHFDVWPGFQSSIVTVDGKEYPTTLPRLGMTTAKGGPLGLGDSEDEDDEDGLHLHGNGDEERRSLHKGARRKTSAGLVPVPVVIPVGGSGSSVQSSASASASALRSKSLPHSVANSLDCLTNEAYEDDEDLLGQPEAEADSKWKKAVVPTGVTTIITTGGSSSSIAGGMATHDKDFITKL